MSIKKITRKGYLIDQQNDIALKKLTHMPTTSTIAVSELSALIITLSNDGVFTISYTGQSSITISAGSYAQIYTYGVLGSGTNPLTFAVKTCTAPTGLKSASYVNNSAFTDSLGTTSAGKYAIIGSGDLRPLSIGTGFVYIVDNQSLNSGSSPYPNFVIVRTSSAGAVVTFYFP
ncbi:MAG: hypothetical protein JWO03_2962 [Bacteroidetes bacterium]|nr:hypothetical protein [Bacteroidota bacterium]